ncbi:MAG: 23S rRNA (guanosine(2251)-2'-O)-methyltransferase RlmB [Rhizobiaceae bacterium]
MRNNKNQNNSRRSGKGSQPKAHQSTRQRGGKAVPADVLQLYGLHTVRAALENDGRRKIMLHVSENALPRLGEDLVDRCGVEVTITHGSVLDKMVGVDAVHQGAVLECAPLNTLDASELFHLVDARLLLALDQITDPHNVGAILRSAVAMGVEAVLMTSRNSAVETAVLAKSASGALDMVKLVHLRNLTKGLDELNEMGFATIGLDSEGPLILEDTLEESKGRSVCLVLGSEGKGLREMTRETCTALARLDMPGAIKSLNVSNAAALSLYVVAKSLEAK